IRLAPGKPEVIDHVEVGILAVDQKRIIKSDHQSIAGRRKLQYTGAVHLTVVIDGRGAVLGEPRIDMLGLIDPDSGEIQIEDNLADEVLAIIDDMTLEERLDDHFIAEELRIGVRRFVFHVLGVKPKTTVHIMQV
ncbi:MAG: ribonuclease J, partial [Proteobacteria bacterium]|nr:ribonuclease J [Pseudomonadota bacterium]